MIKDMRFGFSIIKYALNYDGIITGFLLSWGASAIYGILIPVPILPGLLIGLGTVGLVQSINSATVSTMIQSSPYKKKLRTTIPAYFAFISLLVANLMSIGIHWISYRMIKDSTYFFFTFGYDSKTWASSIVICSVILVSILLYTVIADVFYWTGIFVGIVMWILFRFSNQSIESIFWEISMETAIVLSYVVVLLGSIVLYVVNCLVYKFEYSPLSFRSLLKRACK